MTCIHPNKTHCTYCEELLNKSLQEFINDHYYSRAIGTASLLERYYQLKAWTEKNNMVTI